MPFDPICIANESSEFEFDRVTRITRNYNLKGFATRFAAEQALSIDPTCPLFDPDYPFLIRRPFSVQGKQSFPDERTATVSWEDFIPPEVDREILSGSVSMITQPIKNTYRHVGSFGPGDSDPMDAGGLINVTEDGANGVDYEFPVLAFSIRKLFPRGTFDIGFLVTSFEFAGRPNTDPWRGFGSGTVRLMGIDGSNEGDGRDFEEVTFSFQASPTVNNIIIPSPLGNITIPEKLGWQYVHVQSVEFTSPTTGITSFVPHTAHVDEIGPGIDLNILLPDPNAIVP